VVKRLNYQPPHLAHRFDNWLNASYSIIPPSQKKRGGINLMPPRTVLRV
jgi:hypothetical protein